MLFLEFMWQRKFTLTLTLTLYFQPHVSNDIFRPFAFLLAQFLCQDLVVRTSSSSSGSRLDCFLFCWSMGTMASYTSIGRHGGDIIDLDVVEALGKTSREDVGYQDHLLWPEGIRIQLHTQALTYIGTLWYHTHFVPRCEKSVQQNISTHFSLHVNRWFQSPENQIIHTKLECKMYLAFMS